jgi:hypothetical protein
MPSIMIATMPIHGHVTPLLAVARHLAGRGDRVRFLTGSRFAGIVEATGAEHLALPAEADFDDRQDWNKTFPERAALKGTKAITHDIEHVFVRPGPARPNTTPSWPRTPPSRPTCCSPTRPSSVARSSSATPSASGRRS